MLSALLGTPKYLALFTITKIEFFCDYLPVEIGKLIYQISIGLLLSNNFPKEGAFKWIPTEG